MSCSVNASPKASDRDEIFMKQRLQFADSLKDLKNLRKQLYSAAECFESSYNKDNHKHFVIESSKDYVAKALVSTVDHLGSVANKLNKLLHEESNEFSATKVQFSLIEQRLSTSQGFIRLKGLSQHLLKIEATAHHKHSILPETCASGKSEVLDRNCVSSVPHDVQQYKEDNSYSEAFQAARMKKDPPLVRKEQSRMPSKEPSPNPSSFSFTNVITNKEAAGRRSISPHRFPFNLSGTIIKRSISPTPSVINQSQVQWPSEPRRAISACRRHETMTDSSRDKEMEESYIKRSKHLFKALLSLHQSRKEILPKQIISTGIA